MGLEQRLNKMEQSIGTQAGLCCDRCRDFPYLPDVVNTKDCYYSHPPCRSCGRKFTYCVRIITESAAADVTSGGEPITVHTFNFLRGAVIDEFTNES